MIFKIGYKLQSHEINDHSSKILEWQIGLMTKNYVILNIVTAVTIFRWVS